ncbi:MAG TPA: T9SS type A sorting domain-containing protein, partial [Ignavibacteria bacterium]
STISIGGGSGAGQLAIERGYVLDMRSQGLFKLNANYSVITSILENVITGVPSKFTLYQNYPNPFNPSTTIKFDLPVSGFVKLKIYNILGREISTLVNEIRNAGTYEINYNASALSTGIYFYKLEFGGNSEVRKFTLIK